MRYDNLQINLSKFDIIMCNLPWTSSCKHLGNTIVSSEAPEAGDIRSFDVKKKRAANIDMNNDLIQELYFTHPKTINEVNKFQSTHFYGSILWKLGSRPVEKVEKTWNTSVGIMFNLPLQTHCYLEEPVSDSDHAQILMAREFLKP